MSTRHFSAGNSDAIALLDEPIRVTLDAAGRPLRFWWLGRQHVIESVVQQWQVDTDWLTTEGRVYRDYYSPSRRTACCWTSIPITWPAKLETPTAGSSPSFTLGRYNFARRQTVRESLRVQYLVHIVFGGVVDSCAAD